MNWINEFTGKRKKLKKIKSHNGIQGDYLVKTDTTPEDPDFFRLELQDQLIQNGFEMDNYILIKEIKHD